MSLADRADTGGHRGLPGDTGNVAEYLMSEVLAKQSAGGAGSSCCGPVWWTSWSPGWSRPSPDGLRSARPGGHGAGNAFVEPVPGRRGCYRYQALFREFLRSQLEFEKPGLVGELHRMAAGGWRDGRLLAAIRHAARAQDWAMATELSSSGSVSSSCSWVERRTAPGAPRRAARRPQGADAAVTRAALALSELDLLAAERHWGWRGGCSPRTAPAQSQVRALAITVLNAVAASLGADPDGGLTRPLSRSGPSSWRRPGTDALVELRAIVSGCKGRVLFQRGDLEAGSRR